MQPDMQPQHGKIRRRVLQASLAAPVVLTVSSASAATTSFARCLANNATMPDAFFTQGDDGWFRQPVQVSMLWSRGRDQGYYFLDEVKNVWVSIQAPYTALTFGEANMDPGWKISSSSTRWALVWFDKATTTQYSKITLQRPSGSTATTMSCYGSFNKA